MGDLDTAEIVMSSDEKLLILQIRRLGIDTEILALSMADLLDVAEQYGRAQQALLDAEAEGPAPKHADIDAEIASGDAALTLGLSVRRRQASEAA